MRAPPATPAPFPAARPRRLRRTAALRALVRETRLSAADLIWPIFVTEGEDAEQAIPSMPGVTRRTVDRAVAAAEEARELGIGCICVFPSVDPALKSMGCEEAWNPDNLSNRTFRAVRAAVPEVMLMSDVALDPYNAAGHDGIVRDGRVINDESVEALVRMALAQASAGADILGPSDMMDGRVGAMRAALEAPGHRDVAILSYAAKFASAFYGPFRDAVGAADALAGSLGGDKSTYQIDPANGDEALRMVARDLSRGRGHGDGQTRPALSRRLPPGEGRLSSAHVRLSSLGRVRDDPRRRGRGLDRRAPRHDGEPDGVPPRRLRRDPHLLCPGRGARPPCRLMGGGSATPVRGFAQAPPAPGDSGTVLP